jgi:hypothetical protein
MANYYGSARSNYFRVKSETAFLAALHDIPDIEVHTGQDGTVCVLVTGGDFGGWPTLGWNEDTDEDYEIDLPAIVSEHLEDDEVAIFMESGAEKLRYVVGYAVAVNNKGEREEVSLYDIYELAAGMTSKPENIIPAEY